MKKPASALRCSPLGALATSTAIAGDVALGEKLFNNTKLSTNGMSCASCDANHGTFQASFIKPYPTRSPWPGTSLAARPSISTKWSRAA